MITNISNGWFYIRDVEDFSHPEAMPYRGGFRFSMKPEILVDVFSSYKKLIDKHPDIWAWYSKWVRRLGLSDKIKSMKPSDINLRHDFKMSPMDHQLVTIAFSLNIPSAGLFLEQGTGKTYSALLAAQIRVNLGRVKKPLVIAPAATLQTSWEEDCHKFTDLKPIILHDGIRMRSWVCPVCQKLYKSISDNHAKQHFREIRELLDIDITRSNITRKHYMDAFPECHSVLKENEVYKSSSIKDRIFMQEEKGLWITSPDMAKSNLNDIIKAGFDMVILDESTMIKSPTAERTKAIHKIGDAASYRLMLTGTPITNNLEDAWSQARFLDCSLGPKFGDFVDRYFWKHNKYHYIRNPKSGAGEEIRSILKDRCIRFTKSDCIDLPERTFLARDVKMSSKAYKAYVSMADELFAIMDTGEEVVATTVMNRIQKLQQITNGFLINDDETVVFDEKPPKVREVKSIMEQTSGKVIIWCVYKRDKETLLENLKEYNPVVLKTSNILDGIDKFKNDDSCRIAISNPKSCKFGLTLNNSNTTVYYSMSYSVEDYLQSLDRNHRKGQTLPVTVYHLIGSPIDQIIYDAVRKNVDFGMNIVNHKHFKAMVYG